jgi:RHS repeat-associated protein
VACRCAEVKDATKPEQGNPPIIAQQAHYDPWGVKLPLFSGYGGDRYKGSPEDRFKYNGKEQQPDIGYYDYGARMYDPTVGRWFGIDPLAEANEDLTPYNYAANNPISNIDFLGLTDVNGDGVDDGTVLPEVVVRGKRNTDNEGTLNNIQTTLDVIGLYPGAGTVAGVVNAGIDIYRGNYGNAGLNLLSAVPLLGTAMKGTKLAVLGTKAISSMAKMKVVKAGITAFYVRGKVMAGQAINSHHIIPERLFKRLKNEGLFNDVPGFDVNAMYNRMDLPGVGKGLKDQFHGKHSNFTDTVENMLRGFAANNANGKLTPVSPHL